MGTMRHAAEQYIALRRAMGFKLDKPQCPSVTRLRFRWCRGRVAGFLMLGAFDGPVAGAVAFDDAGVGAVAAFPVGVGEYLGDHRAVRVICLVRGKGRGAVGFAADHAQGSDKR